MRLPLVERFHSVQGEGWNAGRSALFIRFAGCNLDCVFADGSVCDTPWEKPQEKVELKELVDWVDEALDKVDIGLDPETWPMVVITGGEPTIAPAFDALVEELLTLPVYIAVETNGTRWRPALKLVHHVTVSPKDNVKHGYKLPNRDMDPTMDPRVWALPPDEYRYVITRRDEPVPPVHPVRRATYVSPAFEDDGQGTYYLEHGARMVPGAVERCLEIVQQDPRFRISLQTHKFLGVR